MAARDLVLAAGAAGVSACGFYIMAAPRRLFTRADEPARYRPEAVDYDSPHGGRLRRMAPAIAFLPLAFLLAYWLLGRAG